MKHEYISRSFKTCQALPLTLVDAVDNAAVFGKGQQFHKIWTPAWAIKITYSNKKSALKSSQAKDKKVGLWTSAHSGNAAPSIQPQKHLRIAQLQANCLWS